MENDTDNDQGDKDIEDMEVKEEVLDYEIGHVEEELVIIPVQENWSKNVKGFSDKEAYRSSISLIVQEGSFVRVPGLSGENDPVEWYFR